LPEISVEKQINNILMRINALPEQTNKAMILALNRTAEWIKGRLSKEISSEMRIKLKLVRDKIKISKANKRELQAVLNCNMRGIPVASLGNPRQTPPGAVVGNRLFKGAFVATIRKGGQQGVYRRKTKERFPLKTVRIEIFNIAKAIIEELLGKEVKEVFEKRFLHEITRITGAIA